MLYIVTTIVLVIIDCNIHVICIIICSNSIFSFHFLSCDLTSDMEERSFYLFEGASCLIGLAAYSIVRQRQKMLDHMLMEKVNRQIASGV